MTKNLFDEFEAITSKVWKQKIQVDLKGADYNETLIWQTNEGVDVKPFYHSDEFDTLPEISKTSATKWKVCQFFEVNDVAKANKLAKDAVERGAESLIFQITSDTIVIKNLLEEIDLTKIKVFLKYSFLSHSSIKQAFDFSSGNITILMDIIGNLARSGNWFKSLNEDHKELESILKSTNQLTVDLDLYQNSGANIVQQLAYALAHVNEYLNHFESMIDKSSKKTLKVTFQTSVGNNYFFEIAKLRALRNLWSILAREYGINEDCIIVTSPSKRNKTIYDYNVNMLRTTTECMSAIIGGANIIYNLPYDNLYHESNEFGNRIARNQLLVLKNESYLDKVNNPADGAYYIESLTEQLGKKALDLFKNIEKNGGFLSQLKEGTIQRKIKESASKEQEDFDSGKLVLLGTNKHPNPEDKMKSNIDKNPFLKKEPRKTIIEPIIEKRLAEQLEINRLNEE